MANVFNLTPLTDFNPDVEVGLSIAQKWETWLSDFTMFVVASGITNKTGERALLLYIAGSRVREIFATLADTGDNEDFESAKTKLTEYFSPQKNRRYEIYQFREMKQEDG